LMVTALGFGGSFCGFRAASANAVILVWLCSDARNVPHGLGACACR
jgi:hypothetical protein